MVRWLDDPLIARLDGLAARYMTGWIARWVNDWFVEKLHGLISQYMSS